MPPVTRMQCDAAIAYGDKTGKRARAAGEGTQPLSRALPCALAAMEFVMAARRILRIQSPIPLGEVTVVPAALSGRAESDTARAMTAAAVEHEMPTAADVLRRMRRALPLAPIGGFAAARGRGIG